MQGQDKERVMQYAFAVGVTALALMLRLSLTGLMGTGAPFLLFFVSITATAWYGGLRPGILATLLAAFLAAYLFIKPSHPVTIYSLEDWVKLGLFVGAGLFICLICESLHKARTRLEESVERTRIIVATAMDGVIVSDQHGVIGEWNPQAEIIFGWTRAEAVGRPMSELIVPREMRAAHESGMKHYLATGEQRILNRRIEIFALNKLGAIFPIELTITPQRVGGTTHFTAFVRDITERKNTEEMLKSTNEILERRVAERTAQLVQSRSFLRTIIDNVADPIFVKDRTHRWIEGNTAFWNLIGSEAGAKGKTDYDVFPPAQAENFWAGDERVFAGEIFDEEEQILTAAGQNLTIATKKVCFHLETGAPILVGIIRDVTEQRRFEAELRRHRDHLKELVDLQTRDLIEAKDRAEAANIAKSEFLANMSHEIRTPMNAIIGISNILAGSEPLSPKQRNYLGTLQMSADSLLTLINDLLDISKIEARTVALEHIPFSLTALTQEIISMMAFRVREKGLHFTLDAECVRDRTYLGDPTRLRQIILNLCSNAVKFTEMGGVHLRLTCHPGQDAMQEIVCIAVKDTGIGIPPEKLDSVFQKFVQADTSINRKYGGTGLGLAISKTLAEIMGASLRVESAPGAGSLFTLCIPLVLAAEAPPPVAEEPEPAARTGRKRILLVEDYPANVLVATTFLERFDYAYDVAGDGLEALEKLAADRYDAVLMDVQMHGMNGLEATRLLRAREACEGAPSLPVIGMTAHALTSDRERCLGVGMDDYLAKPFDPEELRRKLAHWTDPERQD